MGGCGHGGGYGDIHMRLVATGHKFISRKYVAMTYEKSYWQTRCAWLKIKVGSWVGKKVGIT